MSFISGTVGAILGSSAQNKANELNAANVAATNALNYKMFQDSRGASGSAVLPEYLDAGTERLLGNKAAQVALAMFPNDPQAQLAHYQAIVDQLRPTINAGNDAIAGIYNGTLDKTREAALDPVLAARLNAAKSQGESIDMGLADAVNQMGAQDAAKGFAGTGSYAQNRLLAATLAARQAASQATSGAVLTNATDKRNLSDEMSKLKLSSVDMPVNRAQQLMQLDQMPTMALGSQVTGAMKPLDYFRISPSAFKADPMPQVQPVASAGQLAASGFSQTGGALLNSYLQSKGTMFGGSGWGSGAASGASNVALQHELMPTG